MEIDNEFGKQAKRFCRANDRKMHKDFFKFCKNAQ